MNLLLAIGIIALAAVLSVTLMLVVRIELTIDGIQLKGEKQRVA